MQLPRTESLVSTRRPRARRSLSRSRPRSSQKPWKTKKARAKKPRGSIKGTSRVLVNASSPLKEVRIRNDEPPHAQPRRRNSTRANSTHTRARTHTKHQRRRRHTATTRATIERRREVTIITGRFFADNADSQSRKLRSRVIKRNDLQCYKCHGTVLCVSSGLPRLAYPCSTSRHRRRHCLLFLRSFDVYPSSF